MDIKNIPIYSTRENCVFIWKLFNNRTADGYDDMFTSGCNLIVCLNRRLNRRLNVGRISQWYRVCSSTFFTFGYPNLMLSFLQYISISFNIDIATFVGFQTAVYTYVVLRTFTYTRTSSGSPS